MPDMNTGPDNQAQEDSNFDYLKNAVEALADGLKMVAECTHSLMQKMGEHDAWKDNFNDLAEQKKHADMVSGLKDKYGESMKDVADMHSQLSDGEDVYEQIVSLAEEAEDAASKVEGGEPFDFEKFADGQFSGLKEKYQKARSLLGGKPDGAVKVESVKAVPGELTDEEEGHKLSAPLIEGIRKMRKKKE